MKIKVWFFFSGGRHEGSKCNLKFQSATWSQAPALHCLLYLLNINLKEFLKKKDYSFLTMTMIAHPIYLVNFFYKNDPTIERRKI